MPTYMYIYIANIYTYCHRYIIDIAYMCMYTVTSREGPDLARNGDT